MNCHFENDTFSFQIFFSHISFLLSIFKRMYACCRFTWILVTIVCHLIGVCAPLSLLSSLSLPATRISSPTRKCLRRWDDVWCLHAAAAAAADSGSVDIREALDANKEETQLPIFAILAQICSSLVEKPNLLLEAPPGAVRIQGVLSLCYLLAIDLSEKYIIYPNLLATKLTATQHDINIGENNHSTTGTLVGKFQKNKRHWQR